ncbi:MAG: lipopolysaccharide kinase InaA family protein [Planctomycetota bacterium]|nr:lipopolysaccharide kinase InaA family protein [Planctomycetota bacterium]
MRWCAPGFDEALRGLTGALLETIWPGPPPGYAHVTPPRPMRTVLRGTWRGPHGVCDVVVKWQRPDRLPDRVSRRVRGGKGPREGEVLRALAEAGVPVPRPLAYEDERCDVLVTLHEADLAPMPPAEAATPSDIEAVATLLARAHAAGLRHRDLHAKNLALCAGWPMLVDLGGARVGDPLDEDGRCRELARLVHGLLGDTRRTQRLRALIAYEAARGHETPRAGARAVANRVEALARHVRRRYRRGRDRRARRTGKHFEQLRSDAVPRGARFRDTTDDTWWARAEAWLWHRPEDATPLKTGADVLRTDDVVLKYHGPVAPGRLPRPLRAFRCAFALMNRGIAVPLPHLAAAKDDGSGVYAAAYVDAPDLHTCVAAGDVDAGLLRRLGRALRLMHDAEVTHRDLKAPNLLVAPDGTFPVVDLEGVRIRRGPVRLARRARDLMRLDASLDLPEAVRREVLVGYYDVLPRPRVAYDAFVARVAALTAKKRGPSGQAR